MTVYLEQRGARADPSVVLSDWQIVIAARAALDAHGVLEGTYDSEPNPTPDAVSWTRWHTDVHLPAHHTWQATIDCLEILLGEDFPGRDGPGWFATCLRILTAEHRPVLGGDATEADDIVGAQPYDPNIRKQKEPH
jgi:hypothetical protein